MKKRYKVRFYKAHDIDLITYMASHTINIRMTLYYVLRAYCNGQVVGVRIPGHSGPRPTEYKKIYYTDLCLDTEKDKKLIDFMESIKLGYRNNFLKNLLRQYLCTPLVEDFLINPSDYPEVEKTTKLLQGNRTMVDIDYETYKKKAGSRKKHKKNINNHVSVKPSNKEIHPVSPSLVSAEKTNDIIDNPLLSTLARLVKDQGISEAELNTFLRDVAEGKTRQSFNEDQMPVRKEAAVNSITKKNITSKGTVPSYFSDDRSVDEELETDVNDDDDLTDAFSQILSM